MTAFSRLRVVVGRVCSRHTPCAVRCACVCFGGRHTACACHFGLARERGAPRKLAAISLLLLVAIPWMGCKSAGSRSEVSKPDNEPVRVLESPATGDVRPVAFDGEMSRSNSPPAVGGSGGRGQGPSLGPPPGRHDRGPHGGPDGDLRGNVAFERSLVYGVAGNRTLTLDLVRPREPSAATLPLIIRLDNGPPSCESPRLMRLAASGDYICASVGYVPPIDPAHPTRMPECAEAIEWLRANAALYKIEPRRIGLWFSTPDGEAVCTLERGTLNVLAESTVGSGPRMGPGPGGSGEVAAFFDKHLRGRSDEQVARGPGGRPGGGGRGMGRSGGFGSRALGGM